ncbi:hypothetical protein HDU96_005748 [Phlyctochytrium bullatum]|nr:hypothetical protein HDU96_005748 [Phlyctochytrium bullatum]
MHLLASVLVLALSYASLASAMPGGRTPTPTPTTTAPLPTYTACTTGRPDVFFTTSGTSLWVQSTATLSSLSSSFDFTRSQYIVTTIVSPVTAFVPATTTKGASKCTPTVRPKRRMTGYWGPNRATTPKPLKNLRDFCLGHVYSKLTLTFLNELAFDATNQWLTISITHSDRTYQNSYIFPTTSTIANNGMRTVGDDIKFCQSQGVKIYLNFGDQSFSMIDVNNRANLESKSQEERGTFVAKALLSLFFGRDSNMSPAINLIGAENPYGSDVVLDGLNIDYDPLAVGPLDRAFVGAFSAEFRRNAIPLSLSTRCDFDVDAATYPFLAKNFDEVAVHFYTSRSCDLTDSSKTTYAKWIQLLPDVPIAIGVAGSNGAANLGTVFEPSIAALKTSVENAVFKSGNAANAAWFGGLAVWDVSAADDTTDSTSSDNYAVGLRKMLNSFPA